MKFTLTVTLAVAVIAFSAHTTMAQSGSSNTIGGAVESAVGGSSTRSAVESVVGGSSTRSTVQGEVVEPTSVIILTVE